MRALLTVLGVAATVACLAAGSAFAGNSGDKGIRLDHKAITPAACNGAGSTLLVNVTYGLTDDADSGFGGNAWASDTIHRTLQIWSQADGSFCAVVGDTGSFVTYAGTSPSGGDTVSAGVQGELQGGYVATIQGTLKATPDYATSGNLGTFDLGCGGTFTCPGPRPSFTSYVDTTGYDLPSWGWIYRTAQNGTWVNQSSDSGGDVTG